MDGLYQVLSGTHVPQLGDCSLAVLNYFLIGRIANAVFMKCLSTLHLKWDISYAYRCGVT